VNRFTNNNSREHHTYLLLIGKTQGDFTMQNKQLYQISTIALLFMIALFSISTTALAARPDTAICNNLNGAAAGLCRAAVSSGCAANGGQEATRYCSRLADNYRKIVGSEPVWLTQAPVTRTSRDGSLSDF